MSDSFVLYNEGATQAQEDTAKDIMECLTMAYPGYPWAVKVYDGGFFIRNLDFPKNWGMNQPKAHKYGSASEMKRDVIMKAGEWLERANLRRGRANGDAIVRLEGIPDADQPNYVPPKPMQIVMADGKPFASA